MALHRTMKLPCKASLPQASGRQSGQVKATSQSYKCVLCGGSHPGKRGQVRKFLSVCNNFLEMSVPQRWNCVRRHKLCQVCFTQEEHGHYGQNCPLKNRLVCKCGSERMHHKLLCSSNASHPVSTSENPKGEDDGKDDKGAKKKSKKKNKKASSNSSLGQISYENTDSLKTKKP